MAGLKDNFELLKRSIIGTKTTDIDAKLDKAVTDITNFKSQSGRNGYIDLVRNLISKSTSSFNIDSSSKGVFGQGTSSPAMFGQQKRLVRYKSYEGTISTIDYCYRALDVLTDNICSPDDITKTVLEIKPKKFLEDETPTESKTVQVKGLIESLKIEEFLPLIVRNTLLFGDFFCEIAAPKTALTSSSYLAEQQQIIKSGNVEEFSIEIKDQDPWKIKMNYESFITEAGEEKKADGKKNNSDIVLLFHDPSRVVKLQSELYPICFGYLIFPKSSTVPQLSIQDQAVNDICNSILKNLSKKVPQVSEFDSKELKDIVGAMLASGQDQSKATSIRYVPPDKIQHFMRPSTKYEPYGESIFDSCQFTAKCLVAMETALAVQRLARSTEKRKIAVEIGLPRDARKMIEKLKEELRKRKVTLDNFGTVDTIPSMITTFEDVYIPQKDGKPFVDISTFNEGNVDVRSKVEELKFLRDSVVASLGVPPSFINIEENLCCHLDTKIKLLSGETITLKDIIDNFNDGVSMHVYSCNNEGKIVPGKITWAGVTRTNTKCIRVWLDNDEYIDCTPDHPFMLRDGSYKEAKYLKENESLMPFYTKRSNSYTSLGYTYESIYHPGSNTWQLTHRAIAESTGIVIQGDGKDVHHLDFCPNNNDPNNLKGLYKYQHIAIHGKHTKFHRLNQVTTTLKCKICGNEYKNIPGIDKVTCSKECLKKYHQKTGRLSYEKRKKENGNKLRSDLTCFICGQPTKWTKVEVTDDRYNDLKNNRILSCEDPGCKKRIRSVSLTTKKGKKLYSNIEYRNCDICNKLYLYSEDKIERKKIILTNTCGSIKCNNTVLARRNAEIQKEKAAIEFKCELCGIMVKKPKWYVDGIKSKKCDECREETKYIRSEVVIEKKIARLNHKVKKIELLEGLYDTGDITVEGYHNFATAAGVIVHNSNKAALTEENILFARTIVSHQKYITHQINKLIQKVYDIISPEEALSILDNVLIALPSPKSLQYEREARYLGELANLIETLERVGIPREYTKKKYLSNIDWEDLKNYEVNEKIETALGTDKEEDPNALSGGMSGMGSY